MSFPFGPPGGPFTGPPTGFPIPFGPPSIPTSSTPSPSTTNVSSSASTTTSSSTSLGSTMTPPIPTSSTASPSPIAATSHDHTVAAIVGGVVGGLFFILILLALTLLLWRRKKSAPIVSDGHVAGSVAVSSGPRMNESRRGRLPTLVTPFSVQMDDSDSTQRVPRKGEPLAIGSLPGTITPSTSTSPLPPTAPSTVSFASDPGTQRVDLPTALDVVSRTPMTVSQRRVLMTLLGAAGTSNANSPILPGGAQEGAVPDLANILDAISDAWSNTDNRSMLVSSLYGVLASDPSALNDLNRNSFSSPPPYSG